MGRKDDKKAENERQDSDQVVVETDEVPETPAEAAAEEIASPELEGEAPADEATPEPEPAPEPRLYDEAYVNAVQARADDLAARLQDTYAAARVREQELQKVRERLERHQEKRIFQEKVRLFEQLLEPMDNLERAWQASQVTQDLDSLLQGLELVHRHFEQALTGLGLERYGQPGDRFDPEIHDAISVAPVDSRGEHDRIHTVYQAGYRLGDTVIRPARVIVGKHGG